jgi:Trypsin
MEYSEILVFFLVFVNAKVIFSSVSDCGIGESCILPNSNSRKLGIVKEADNCEEFLRLSRPQQIKYGHCGFVLNTPIPLICCPSVITSRHGSQTRKATKMCQKYGNIPKIVSDVRIIGGTSSRNGEFPHLVALGYREHETLRLAFHCGGSIISERFVITAAHCCKKSRLPHIVRLGEIFTNEPDSDDYVDVTVEVN